MTALDLLPAVEDRVTCPNCTGRGEVASGGIEASTGTAVLSHCSACNGYGFVDASQATTCECGDPFWIEQGCHLGTTLCPDCHVCRICGPDGIGSATYDDEAVYR